MITWKETETGNFAATCGEYALVVTIWEKQKCEGCFYRNSDYLRMGSTGDKPDVETAKAALMDLVFEQIKKDVRAQSETIRAFWDLKLSMERDKLCTNEKPSTKTVRELIDAGYIQVSSKYRALARLPPDKTALEALEARYPEQAAHVREQCERIAKSRALALLGQFDRVELTPAEFAEFKRLKGPVA